MLGTSRSASSQEIKKAYLNKYSLSKLKEILGRGKAKKGMFEGDVENGELEIGQISAYLDSIKPAEDIINEIIQDFFITREKLNEY